MKIATLNEGGRDGRLIVVDRKVRRGRKDFLYNCGFRRALEEWELFGSKLGKQYDELNRWKEEEELSFALDFSKLAAPLPRAFQWVDGSAYVNHVELVRKARGATMPENFWTDPLVYQGGSDGFLGPRADIAVESEAWGIDFEAEVAVITGDVPMGISPERALDHILFLMLVNDVSLRNLIPAEIAKGFGFFQSKPASAFSPAAVTPDELGDAWKGGKLHLPLITRLNGEPFGQPDAGCDMTFHFGELISHAARTRHLSAGTIIGSGTVSNVDRAKGSSCIAERRMLEILEHGEARTPFMKFGDRVEIEMLDKSGNNIFGTIDQKVVPYRPPA